ncbi:Uu.00g108690.m01.CDS01 [Anthostomella pinea]|uniref:Uu.00g108690.m01.CDS01 n=1 Tax=Anthostomella pinea TaxID=933095 RepID=A0AAI8VEM7_9PEZI|nr:Uu.00g108690.m01.CDS01 [Anthostomella pinea]
MAPRSPEDILAQLQALVAKQEITILKLSEPISTEIAQLQDPHQRTSDISNASLDATTPASLEADLTHYRELFAKLRFSYVEQVTKEKFIRAIVGDPPLIVSPQENVDLEKQNLEAKATLKVLKTEVADMVTDLEEKAKDLSRKYERIKLETVKLEEMPAKISELEDAVAQLRETRATELSPNPELNLPLAKTLDLVESKKRQRAELDRQLEQLQSQVPRKKKELERLHAEMQPLEAKRQNSTTAAKESRRRKEAALGGVEDDLEERGRWFRAAETGLKQMLEIEN